MNTTNEKLCYAKMVQYFDVITLPMICMVSTLLLVMNTSWSGGQSTCDQCGNRITSNLLLKMHMKKITASWQVLNSLYLLCSSAVQGSGIMAPLEDVYGSYVMQKHWDEQVFTRYNPEYFLTRKSKLNRGFDQTEPKKPEKPLLTNLHNQPVIQNLSERPRPSAPINIGGSNKPDIWIPFYMPRFYSLRERLAKQQVVLELGLVAKIKL